MMKGWAIPGHKWWRRNEESLLYGKGMKISTFQVRRLRECVRACMLAQSLLLILLLLLLLLGLLLLPQYTPPPLPRNFFTFRTPFSLYPPSRRSRKQCQTPMSPSSWPS